MLDSAKRNQQRTRRLCTQMHVLFVHNNIPGQFKHLVRALRAEGGHTVSFVAQHVKGQWPGVQVATWNRSDNHQSPPQPPILSRWDKELPIAEAVYKACRTLVEQGGTPDVIVAHTGWGNGLFLRDAFPDTPLLTYQEYFRRPEVNLAGYSKPVFEDFEARLERRVSASADLIPLTWSDWCLTPTWWQRNQFPEDFLSKMSVLHDGIDSDALRPLEPGAKRRLALPDGTTLQHGDPVVTYVARHFEPIRGIHTAIRAFRRILAARPDCHIIMVGEDSVGYGTPPAAGGSYLQQLLRENPLDMSRLHILPPISHQHLIEILRLSAAHLYLTTPFVLSWSMLEAMACGALVVGSATPPVQEVIRDGENGLLADFDDPQQVADRLLQALEDPQRMHPLRHQARFTIEQRYALKQVLPLHLRLLRELADGQQPPPVHQTILRANPAPAGFAQPYRPQPTVNP